VQKYLRILTLLFCIANSGAYASHIMSAALTYQYIGNNTYQFTLTAYRDCQSSVGISNVVVDYSSASCNIQGSFPLPTLVEIVEVSTTCPGVPTDCSVSGSPNKGYQRYVFTGTIQIPKECTDWVFSWQECNRNTAINTISNPGLTCLYIQSTLNNTLGPVSSPQFSDPNVYIPWQQNTTLNYGAAVTNADSLNFSFITPKSSANVNVAYLTIPGFTFSASDFLESSAPITLNSSTGIVSNVDPTVNNRITVTDILVKQYVNGVVVGTVERAIELVVFPNNNALPVLGGINNVPKDTIITICAGQQLCFKLKGYSPPPDTAGQKVLVSITDSSQISGATFSGPGVVTPDSIFADTALITVCWRPALTVAGNKVFTLKIQDNHCPNNGYQSYSYTIRVLPTPDVIFGATDTVVACSSLPITLDPPVIGGAAPLKYLWSPTNATTTSIKASLGLYTLIVTGANGCADTVSKTFIGGLTANFVHDSVCVGIGQQFFDSSTSKSGAADVKWLWNFGDGSSTATSTLQNPFHTFNKPGTYNVSLTVTDNQGCTATVILGVTVADIPKPNFVTKDPRCQNNPLSLVDSSTFSPLYPIVATNFTVNPVYIKQPGFNLQIVPTDSGIVAITYIITNVNGCTGDTTKKIHINPQPLVSIISPANNIYARCYPGWDTLILAKASWYTGNTLYYNWSDNEGVLGSDSLFSDSAQVKYKTNRTTSILAPDSLSTVQIQKLGSDTYTINVYDDSGCYNNAKLAIFFPIRPEFSIGPYCNRSDTITFTDLSFSEFPLYGRGWSFGDTTPFILDTISPLTNAVVKHFYPYTGNGDTINVSLILEDTTGCISELSGSVYILLPDRNFVVSPDTVCYGQTINLQGPRGSDIYSWTWYLTQNNPDSTDLASLVDSIVNPIAKLVDSTTYIRADTTFHLQNDTTASRTYSYTQGGNHKVNLNLVYNYYNGNYCDTVYTKNVYVHPNFNLMPSVTGRCARDTTSLSFIKVGGDAPAKTAVWQIYYAPPSGGDSLIATDTGFAPKLVLGPMRNPKAQHDNSGGFTADLTVTDINGCQVTKDTTFTAIIVAKPCFSRSDSCLNQGINYLIACSEDTFETYVYYHWDFGDSGNTEGNTNINVWHQYLYPNTNPGYTITYTVSGDSGYFCSVSTSQVLKVYPIPNASFVSDSVCEGLSTLFNSSASTAAQKGDSLVGWHWVFTTLDSKENPIQTDSLYGKEYATYTYSNFGVDSAKLVVVNSSTGCTDTVSHPVFIAAKPKAAFGVAYNSLQAYKALDFIDSSQTGSTGLGEVLVKWKYIFGDGTMDSVTLPPATNGNILHTYSAIAIDTAKEIVTNNYGCTDTTIRILDLHSYLIVPNAFTPSSGNVNDKFHLFYKGITDLKEYKVFDRYGEVVFDGTGDLTAYWDGTFKGDEQPIGVYVYYIVGTTVYGNDIYLKGNLTLIR